MEKEEQQDTSNSSDDDEAMVRDNNETTEALKELSKVCAIAQRALSFSSYDLTLLRGSKGERVLLGIHIPGGYYSTYASVGGAPRPAISLDSYPKNRDKRRKSTGCGKKTRKERKYQDLSFFLRTYDKKHCSTYWNPLFPSSDIVLI
jgi:hypothetical protein